MIETRRKGLKVLSAIEDLEDGTLVATVRAVVPPNCILQKEAPSEIDTSNQTAIAVKQIIQIATTITKGANVIKMEK
jgi:hypothetical protein